MKKSFSFNNLRKWFFYTQTDIYARSPQSKPHVKLKVYILGGRIRLLVKEAYGELDHRFGLDVFSVERYVFSDIVNIHYSYSPNHYANGKPNFMLKEPYIIRDVN